MMERIVDVYGAQVRQKHAGIERIRFNQKGRKQVASAQAPDHGNRGTQHRARQPTQKTDLSLHPAFTSGAPIVDSLRDKVHAIVKANVGWEGEFHGCQWSFIREALFGGKGKPHASTLVDTATGDKTVQAGPGMQHLDA